LKGGLICFSVKSIHKPLRKEYCMSKRNSKQNQKRLIS